MESDDLYQDLLMDHFRTPRCRGCLDHPDADLTMKNPLCGDTIRLTLTLAKELDSDPLISGLAFTGHGCSISQASASIMADLCKGKSTTEVKKLSQLFRKMMSEKVSDEEMKILGDAVALEGVRKFSARIRCALLAWEILDKSVHEAESKAIS